MGSQDANGERATPIANIVALRRFLANGEGGRRSQPVSHGSFLGVLTNRHSSKLALPEGRCRRWEKLYCREGGRRGGRHIS